MAKGYVYILASKKNGTLYTGVTYNLARRVFDHKEGRASEFTKKYGVRQLVYFEEHSLYAQAIQRETNIKRWKREWKLSLIEKMNPEWRDLSDMLDWTHNP